MKHIETCLQCRKISYMKDLKYNRKYNSIMIMKKNRRPSSTLKLHPTDHSQLNDDQYTDEYQDDDMEFQQINHNRQRKNELIRTRTTLV